MSDINAEAVRAVIAAVPEQAQNMARLCLLLDGAEPVVTVVGKYNHGKSTMLNVLIGKATFAVADRRETVQLADSVQHGLCWLDAPGLDADVATGDDRQALQAAWLRSDIRLFVHAAKEGELDGAELALLEALDADSGRTQRKTLFVLSQIDQLPDQAQLNAVRSALSAQLPALLPHPVSSTRYLKGMAEDKSLLVERSGVPQLRVALAHAVAGVPAARTHETALLRADIGRDLTALVARHSNNYDTLCLTRQAQQQAFDAGLQAVIGKVGHDLEAMLDALGPDYAIIPDTARDAYASTAGKRERAHIQMAYSRACIEIDSFLAGHGVIALPVSQETVARSLNTVMIAVMGVSVKFRADLRRMFGTADGRERLHRDFTHYYMISADRIALATRIDAAQSAIDLAEDGERALRSLQAVA